MSINITLYNFSKRENSTARPSGSGVSVSALLKLPTDIVNPSFQLSGVGADYNYIEWDGRYYYRNTARYETNTVVTYECSLDVLATYRSQIMNTSAFVAYSSSDYDVNIPDGRFSMDANVSIESSSAGIFGDDAPAGVNDGTYILEYATSAATYGPSGALWLSPFSASLIAESLNSTGYNDFLEQFSKQFNGAYDAVINCRFVPLDWYGRCTGTKNVVLGGYDTGHIGATIDSYIKYSTSVTIPWQFTDFRNLSPYTSLLMYLPAYGFIELNPTDFFSDSSISVSLYMDGITGIGTYIVGDKVKCVADFSSPVSIGTVRGNAAGLITAGISAVSAVATGGAGIPVAGAIAGVLLSQQRSVGNSGVSGGFAGVKATPGTWTNIYLYTICHDTNVEPANFTSIIGRCLNQVVNIGTLTGYIQTVNASVSVPADDTIADKINSYLNGGVYLE